MRMVSSVGEKLHSFWMKNWRGEIDGAMYGLWTQKNVTPFLLDFYGHIVHACT